MRRSHLLSASFRPSTTKLNAFVKTHRKFSIKVSVVLVPMKVSYLWWCLMTSFFLTASPDCVSAAPNGFLASACGNQSRKLFTESWNVWTCSRRTCRLNFKQAHDFSHHGVVFFSYLFFFQLTKKNFTAQIKLVPKMSAFIFRSFCKFEHGILIALSRHLHPFIFNEICF